MLFISAHPHLVSQPLPTRPQWVKQLAEVFFFTTLTLPTLQRPNQPPTSCLTHWGVFSAHHWPYQPPTSLLDSLGCFLFPHRSARPLPTNQNNHQWVVWLVGGSFLPNTNLFFSPHTGPTPTLHNPYTHLRPPAASLNDSLEGFSFFTPSNPSPFDPCEFLQLAGVFFQYFTLPHIVRVVRGQS